jgi:hypothetical protein
MGPFLAEPLVESLCALAAAGTPLHDARRTLELLVPLVYRPALKAAALDAGAAVALARLTGERAPRGSGAQGSVERWVGLLGLFAPATPDLVADFASPAGCVFAGELVARLASEDEGAEASALLSMACEVAVVLLDPGVCLDPLAPPEQAQANDIPPAEEARPGAHRAAPGGLAGVGAAFPAGARRGT